ncbi:MAG: SdpI family protein [Vicinamibacterales bacterium]
MDLAAVFLFGALYVITSVPLVLGWIPRNYIYGFRFGVTLRDDRVWYAINRQWGREAIVLGILLAVPAALLDFAGYDTPAARIVLTVVTIGGSLWLVVRNWRAALRMRDER